MDSSLCDSRLETKKKGSVITPASPSERILVLDVIRGVALLGILLMNILLFAFPDAAYSNIHAWGQDNEHNRLLVSLMYLLGEGKMRALFSMVFGASAVIFLEKAERHGAGISAADLYFRRMLWLMAFGTVHAYLIWWGDILYTFALFGLILFVFRSVSFRNLLLTAGTLAIILFSGYVWKASEASAVVKNFPEVSSSLKTGEPLSPEQLSITNPATRLYNRLLLSPDEIEKQVAAYRGNYSQNLGMRVRQAWDSQRSTLYFPQGWDMFSIMLLGMALYKSGILTGKKSKTFYGWNAVSWGALGLMVNGWAIMIFHEWNFQPIARVLARPAVDVGRISMLFCYVAGLIFFVQTERFSWLMKALAAVGRMAFSNYIAQSLICSVIFYGGYGLGLFGKLDRVQLLPIVFGIWMINLTWSVLWLRYFQFGPLEWCWRSLTYWKKQPMRLQSVSKK